MILGVVRVGGLKSGVVGGVMDGLGVEEFRGGVAGTLLGGEGHSGINSELGSNQSVFCHSPTLFTKYVNV